MALTKISTGMLKQDAASSDLNIDAGTLYLDVSNNRVGVANTSPTRPLHVNGIAKADAGFEFGNSSSYLYESATDSVALRLGSDGPYLEFIDAGSNVAEIGNASGPLALTSASTERMRIDNSGNVKINDGYLEVDTETSAAAVVRIDYNSTDSIRRIHALETGGGNARPLQIQAQDVRFRDDTSERMRIDSSGNVGIGTTIVKTRLQVSGAGQANTPSLGSVSSNVPLYLTNNDTAYGLVVGNSGATGNVWLQAQRTDGTATAYDILLNPAGGNVGIGTSSPVGLLSLQASSGNSQLFITTNDTTSRSQLIFGDSADSNVGGVQYDHSNDSLQFHVGNIGEKMRIDSSGDLIVGGTSSGANDAVSISNTGYIQAIINGDTAGYFNRRTSDGEIIRLQKDGTTVGSIGVVGSDILYIGTSDGSDAGLNFDGDNSRINPCNGTGTATDNAVDLGQSGARFKDLYLSGSAKLVADSAASAEIQLKQTGSGGRDYRISSTGTGYGSAGSLIFYDATASSERARFDSSGNLLVGKTSANNTSQGVTIYGAIAPGAASFVRDSGNTLVLNRLTNDGEIVAFRKDGTTVGSIATNSSRFELDGSGNPVRMKAGTSNIQVNNNTHISFDTAGGEAARFDSSGNFGIGLTNLGSAKFEVYPGTAANTGAIRTSYGSAWMNIITNLSNGGFNPVSLSGDMGIIFSLDSSSSSASSNGFVIAPWSTAAGGIRIKDNGYVGISVSNASYPLDVKGTIQIQNDGGSGYTHSRLITQSTNASRGSGMFMHNTGSDIEWYAGRPYSSADNFVIARQGTASHSDSTAQLSNSFVVVTSSGNLLVGQTSSSSSTYKFETSSDNSTGARINTVSLGRSSSGYPIVGYNCAPTTTVNTYNKVINDYASWFHFVSGRIDTYTTTTTGTGTTTGTAGPYLSSGGTSWTSSSDSRLKDNIESISYGLEAVKSLNPVSYVRNDRDTGATELGFIAQEVDEVVSEVVSVKDNGYYGIDYERLIPVLTKAIQEQQEIIENLKSRIEQLEQ